MYILRLRAKHWLKKRLSYILYYDAMWLQDAIFHRPPRFLFFIDLWIAMVSWKGQFNGFYLYSRQILIRNSPSLRFVVGQHLRDYLTPSNGRSRRDGFSFPKGVCVIVKVVIWSRFSDSTFGVDIRYTNCTSNSHPFYRRRKEPAHMLSYVLQLREGY